MYKTGNKSYEMQDRKQKRKREGRERYTKVLKLPKEVRNNTE